MADGDGPGGPEELDAPDGPEELDGPDAPEGRDPLRFHRWMRSSSSGAVLTGIALGFQHALEERRDRPAIVMEAPGEPEDPDAPIDLHFDPDDPRKTVAVIRTPPRPSPQAPPSERRPPDGDGSAGGDRGTAT